MRQKDNSQKNYRKKIAGWIKVLAFYIAMAYSFPGISQLVPSSCSAPDSVVNKYRKSADKLAVRRTEHIVDIYKDSISINKIFSNQYLRALLAVYNATDLAARDSVMAFPIHLDFRMPHDLNSIYVVADSSKSWMKNLRLNTLPCGEPLVDQLIKNNHLRITGFSTITSWNSPNAHTVSFETDSNRYIYRLSQKFIQLIGQGVVSSGPNNKDWSDGYNITDSINSNFIELIYSFGWGGCMIPCIYVSIRESHLDS
jgi:hypothetical protein